MSIGILSDTHGYLDTRVFKYFAECDQLWHAGDIGENVAEQLSAFKKLKAVYGNIDSSEVRSLYPQDEVFACQGLKVWITHIAGRPNKYVSDVETKIKAIKPSILVCGHSHILCIKYDTANKLLYINPGAAGKYGIHTVATLVRCEINNSKISNMEVIQLS